MTTTTKHEWETRFVSVDRHGKEIKIGQRLKIKHCVGSHGQCEILEGVLESRCKWRGFTLRLDNGSGQYVADISEYDHAMKWPDGRGVMAGYAKLVDFDHGHEEWIEIVEGA